LSSGLPSVMPPKRHSNSKTYDMGILFAVMVRRWTRANKIALFVGIAALAVALIPYAIDIVSHFKGPRASIIQPAPQSIQPNNMFSADGTASNIPAGDDLWLVVRSGVGARWYPSTRLSPINGQWIVGGGIIRPAAGPQFLEVIMLPDSSEATFVNYVNALRLQNLNPGLAELPSGYKVLYSAQIDVQ
jgi:hypothetical protein